MKRVHEIKVVRQQRFFNKRMEANKANKRQAAENELMTHVDLISNPQVKQFIMKKKEQKLKSRREKILGPSKRVEESDEEMDSQEESEEKMEEGVKVAALAKVKKVTRRKSAIKKINAKLRNK